MYKIVVHDYAGHPFSLTLSKELSKKYKVNHLFFKNDYGPKADFENQFNHNLSIEGIGSDISYDKNNFFTRFIKDFIYGNKVAKRINEIKPDIIISGQCPTFAQELIINLAKKNNLNFTIWVQDFYSIAVYYILKKKISFLSLPISFLFKYFEKKQFKLADHLVLITKDFSYQLDKWGIDQDKYSIIKNWGNLDEIKFNINKDIQFLKENNLDTAKFTLLYTGTLALKHNPDLILKIASFNPNIQILLIGVGSGYDKIKNSKDLPKNIQLLPLQPFNKMNSILNSSDACLSILDEEAGKYSVPSKILNYLCAGKPVIFSGPSENLASKIIVESKSGGSFDSNNFHNLNQFIKKLIDEPDTRKELSRNAREYAEKNFKVNEKVKKFENIFLNNKQNKK